MLDLEDCMRKASKYMENTTDMIAVFASQICKETLTSEGREYIRDPFRNLGHLKIHSSRLLFYNWELPSGTGAGCQQFVSLQVSERHEAGGSSQHPHRAHDHHHLFRIYRIYINICLGSGQRSTVHVIEVLTRYQHEGEITRTHKDICSLSRSSWEEMSERVQTAKEMSTKLASPP